MSVQTAIKKTSLVSFIWLAGSYNDPITISMVKASCRMHLLHCPSYFVSLVLFPILFTVYCLVQCTHVDVFAKPMLANHI